MVQNLPPESALHRAMPETAGWGPLEYIVKHLYDLQAKAHFKDPQPFPTPADLLARKAAGERARARALAWLARHPDNG